MNAIETLRSMAEVWNLFKDLPDEASIQADLAAVFLGISTKTLARLRQNGGGPPYLQPRESKSTARNQKVTYILGDLRSWRESNKVDSSMRAAELRGLAFSTLGDLSEEQPYWQVQSSIVGHVLTVPEIQFCELLNNADAEIVWLPIADALKKLWADDTAKSIFNLAYLEAVRSLIDQGCDLDFAINHGTDEAKMWAEKYQSAKEMHDRLWRALPSHPNGNRSKP